MSKISISHADAELLDALGAVAEHVGGADVDQAALAEVEAAAVERADVGQQLLDVLEPLDAADQVGALDEGRRVLRVEHQVAAHAGGGVDDDVDVAGADPLHRLAVERDLARALAGLRVAHVDVHDRGARPRRGDARDSAICSGVTGTCSDLPDGVAGAGEGTGDDDLAVHRGSHGFTSVVSGARRAAAATRGRPR